MKVGRWPERSTRAGAAICILVVTATAAMAGQVDRTASLFLDHKEAASSIDAAPGVTLPPMEFNVGTLHVGDKCTNVVLGQITATFQMTLSVDVSGGWLRDKEVSVDPTSIGPGDTATVYFTNSAVNGPQIISDTVTVTADPGGVIQTIQVLGEVVNPADPDVHDPDPLPPGCVHPAGKIKIFDPGLVGPDGALLAPEAPLPAPEAPPPAPEAPPPTGV